MSVTIRAHEKWLRTLPCSASGKYPVTLHHCHGGSMKELGPDFPARGKSRKNNPWFQIPLHAEYHVGKYGIDYGYGVLSWERDFGRQLDMLHELNLMLDYDIFELAREWQATMSRDFLRDVK